MLTTAWKDVGSQPSMEPIEFAIDEGSCVPALAPGSAGMTPSDAATVVSARAASEGVPTIQRLTSMPGTVDRALVRSATLGGSDEPEAERS